MNEKRTASASLGSWGFGGSLSWQVVQAHATASVPRKKKVSFLKRESDLLICLIRHNSTVDRAVVRCFRAWGMLLFLVSLFSTPHAVVLQVKSQGKGRQTSRLQRLKFLRWVRISKKEGRAAALHSQVLSLYFAEHWYQLTSAAIAPVAGKLPRHQQRLGEAWQT